MSKPILYLGDTSLATAAGYLAGVMHHAGWEFDYLPSDQALPASLLKSPHRLFIISDYAAQMISEDEQEAIAGAVENGAGLLMLGGWESYHGAGGNWDGTRLGNLLPVSISSGDDRVNCDQPALVLRLRDEHAITADLPWDGRPPTVGGFNAFTAKPLARVLLEVERYRAWHDGPTTQFALRDRFPMLVVGEHGSGRTAALATDVAPHWVGGLVDWGDGRVVAQAPGSGGVEVGDLYARFLRQLLSWTGNLGAA